MREHFRGVRSGLLSITTIAAFTAATPACPVANRYPADYSDGQASATGGAFPNGIRAADDFQIPLGNGNDYNVRIIKAVLIANHTQTPSNVGITIYTDVPAPSGPQRPVPGSIVSGPPNTAPTVRDPSSVTPPGFRAYEISYVLPPGMLQLAANRWYWLSPYAVADSLTDASYAAISARTTVLGEPINRSEASAPNIYTNWTLTTECCLAGGPHDLAMFIDAEQIGFSAADLNCSLIVSVQDIFDFLGYYFSGDPAGDFNGVGGTSVQDIFDFPAAYFGT